MQILSSKWANRYRPTLDHLPVVAVMLFSIVSFISTYSGMYAFMHSLERWVQANLFAFVFTLALQLMLVYAVMAFKGERGLRRKAYWLTVYLICVFFSVGFAYSYWFRFVRADQYARERYLQQVNMALAVLTDAEQRYLRLTSAVVDLAQYSSETAGKEKSEGGTCGEWSAVGSGPRVRLRAEDARILNSFVAPFRRGHEQITEVLGGVRQSTANFNPADLEAVERSLNEAAHKMNAIVKAPELEQLKVILRERMREGRTGIVRQGAKFNCPDKVLEAKGETILKIDLPELEEARIFDPTNPKESLNLAFGRLMYLPATAWEFLAGFAPRTTTARERERRMLLRQGSSTAGAREGGANDDFTAGDSLPLLLGLMVDGLIFLSARRKRGAGRRNSSFDGPEGLREAAERSERSILPDLLPFVTGTAKSSALGDLYQLLKRYELRWTSGGSYIVVPYPARTDEERKLASFMDVVTNILKASNVYRFCLKRDDLPLRWVELHKPELNGAGYVNIFQLSDNLWEDFLLEIMRSLRDDGVEAESRPARQAEAPSPATDTVEMDPVEDRGFISDGNKAKFL